MNHWILSGKGYSLLTYNGDLARYESMAVNMKSYTMSNNINAVVINSRTSESTIREFEQATGRKYVRET